MSRTPRASAHSLALAAGFHHIGAYVANTLLELALRLLCLAPLLYLGITGGFFGAQPDHATGIALLCCLPLWLIIALPLRFRLGGAQSRWLGLQGTNTSLKHYFRWLGQLLVRLLKALPFLLPLMAWLLAYYYYIKMVDFTGFFLMIRSVGSLVGGDYVAGMALLMLLLLACLVLAIIGWRRLMVFFYLPLQPLARDNERLRRIDWPRLRQVSLINLVILLPALALFLLGSLFQGMKGDIQRDALNILSRLAQFDLVTLNIGQTLPWLVLLYLPFVLWRKMALAGAIHGGVRG